MIDMSLINENISSCRQSLLGKKSTAIDRIFILKNFFTQSLLDKLMLHILNSNAWQKVERQEHKKRTALLWEQDSVLEETYLILDSLSPYINQIFSKSFKMTGMQVWKDSAGYYIEEHLDNERVGCSLQIYLTTCTENLGTNFSNKDLLVQIPYQINAGYVTDQGQTIMHSIGQPVPEGHTRYSIYAVWK